jgi:hypothetical protein
MFVLRVMEIVDTAMLYLMTIGYLNSPVTGQGDFLFPVSNNTLSAFLCYVICFFNVYMDFNNFTSISIPTWSNDCVSAKGRHTRHGRLNFRFG